MFLHIPMTGGTTLREQISTAFDPAEICPHRSGLPPACPAEELQGYRFFSGCFSPDEIRRIPGDKYVFTVLRDPLERLLSLSRSAAWHWLPGAREAMPETGSAGGAAIPRIRRAWMRNAPLLPDNDLACRLAGSITATGAGTYLREEGGVRTPIAGAEIVRLAVTNLRRFDFVGFTEELDLAYARVAHEFGLPQAPGTLPRRSAAWTGHHAAGPDGETWQDPRAELAHLIELDMQVFAMARLDRRLPQAACGQPDPAEARHARAADGPAAIGAIPLEFATTSAAGLPARRRHD